MFGLDKTWPTVLEPIYFSKKMIFVKGHLMFLTLPKILRMEFNITKYIFLSLSLESV